MRGVPHRKQAERQVDWHRSSRLLTACERRKASPPQPGKPPQVGRGKPITEQK
jgi:hypothetical protein